MCDAQPPPALTQPTFSMQPKPFTLTMQPRMAKNTFAVCFSTLLQINFHLLLPRGSLFLRSRCSARPPLRRGPRSAATARLELLDALLVNFTHFGFNLVQNDALGWQWRHQV
jgi:hypothetical protein